MKGQNKIHIGHYASAYGDMLLGAYCGRLCMCDWPVMPHHNIVMRRLKRLLEAEYEEKDDEIITMAASQLDDYFAGRLHIFDLPLMLVGSDFQRRVWEELLKIPYGEMVSYKQITERVCGGSGGYMYRAVANAVGANAMSIIVPCHRVIGADGSLIGYAGGIEIKRSLLKLETS